MAGTENMSEPKPIEAETPGGSCAPASCSAASHGIHEAIGRLLTLAGIATEPGWELWDADLPGKLDRAGEAFREAYDEAPQNNGTQRPGSPDVSLATETRKPGSLK